MPAPTMIARLLVLSFTPVLPINYVRIEYNSEDQPYRHVEPVFTDPGKPT